MAASELVTSDALKEKIGFLSAQCFLTMGRQLDAKEAFVAAISISENPQG